MDDVVNEITRQVISKLKKNEISPSKNIKSHNTPSFTSSQGENAVIVLTGGREEIEIVLQQMSIINERANKLTVVMTKSAEKLIGVPTVRRATYNAEIITEWVENINEILDVTDTLYVPILTLNSATKCANLMTDNVALIFMVFGILRGKRVRMATNSVYCCEIARDRSKIPQGAKIKIDSILNQLREFGVELVDISQLTGTLTSKTSSPSYSSVTSSIINNPSVSSSNGECTLTSSGDCSACGKCVEHNTSGVQQLVDSGASRIAASLGTTAPSQIAKMIDHTLLKADATPGEIKELCDEAKQYSFASVCVNPTNVALAAENLKGSVVKVCTVIGFPLGATTATTKAIETRDAIANGAQEVDMVINVGALKAGLDDKVIEDIKAVVDAAKGKAIVKVILETALLTKEEIVKGSLLSKMAGADFVKTSTGFSTGGATVEHIALMRQTVGPHMGVKASGGVRDYETAKALVEAGATRIGASASIAIAKGTAGKGY